MHFRNRLEAGQKLAELLKKYKGQDVVVYALPRGGVVLGYEVAQELEAPLNLIITRKIGHPLQPEYAVCAVAEDGDLLCNKEERAALDPQWLKIETEKEQNEARRRRETYLGKEKVATAQGKIAIVIDDGIATGLTMLLAIDEVKHENPKEIIVAVPVVPMDVAEKIKQKTDKLVALDIPVFYAGAVGAYYDEFPPVEDEEVIKLLEINKKR